MKTKARPLVEAFFGFETGQRRKIQAANRDKAETLKEGDNFVYKYIDLDDPEQNTGLCKSKLIQKLVNEMWFRNKTGEGIVFSQYFDPFTKSALALVLTAIKCCLDELVSGTRVQIEFGDDYHDVYDRHLKELDRFEQYTKKHDLLRNYLVKLYNRGRHHAGAQPVSTTGVLTIATSRFEAALKEYEEDPNTDADEENGDSDDEGMRRWMRAAVLIPPDTPFYVSIIM